MPFVSDLKTASLAAGAECRRIARAMSREGYLEEEYFGESEYTFEAVLYRELRRLIPALNQLSLEPERIYDDVDLVYCPDGLLWQYEPWRVGDVLIGSRKIYPVEVKVVQDLKPNVMLSGYLGGIEFAIEKLQKLRTKYGLNNTEPATVVGFTGRVFEDDKVTDYEGILVDELAAASFNTSGVHIVVG